MCPGGPEDAGRRAPRGLRHRFAPAFGDISRDTGPSDERWNSVLVERKAKFGGPLLPHFDNCETLLGSSFGVSYVGCEMTRN